MQAYATPERNFCLQADDWPRTLLLKELYCYKRSRTKSVNGIFKINTLASVRLPLCLGFFHPLQDVALHQCLPLLSVCCFPNSGGSLLLCYVVLPSFAWLSSWSLPSPWLPLCAPFGPPIVLHSCYMTGPFPLLFPCVFYDINYLCSFPDFWACYLIL